MAAMKRRELYILHMETKNAQLELRNSELLLENAGLKVKTVELEAKALKAEIRIARIKDFMCKVGDRLYGYDLYEELGKRK